MKIRMTLLVFFVLASITGCGSPSSVADLSVLRNSVTSYEMTMAAQGAPKYTQLVNGEMRKMKMTVPTGWTLTDMEKKETIAFMNGIAMKMPLQDQEDTVFSPKDMKKGKILGTEKLGDVDCTIVEATMDGETAKAWFGTADGLVRKIDAPSGVVTMSYSRINAVPDSEFIVPANIKVRDMSGLMKGLK